MAKLEFRSEISAIIENGDAKILVKTAQEIAKSMIIRKPNGFVNDNKSVSTSQIRNLYGSSKKIEMNLSSDNASQMYNKLILLKPKMAYANGRFNKTSPRGEVQIPGLQLLVDCLSYAIDKVESDFERMMNFFNFFEAILAYHKAEGGK